STPSWRASTSYTPTRASPPPLSSSLSLLSSLSPSSSVARTMSTSAVSPSRTYEAAPSSVPPRSRIGGAHDQSPSTPDHTSAATLAPAAMSGSNRAHASSPAARMIAPTASTRSEEHTSELQSRENLVCRLLLEKKK